MNESKETQVITIDLFKLIKYMLKFWWLIIMCTVVAFVGTYQYYSSIAVDTYTASATMYVYNANPNMVNYSYISTGDLKSAVELLGTYKVVISSNKVMDAVAERLSDKYPGITNEYVNACLGVESVNETGVMRISCTTVNPELSTDMCNTIVDVAPAEIIRVVNAGGFEVVDYAETPLFPNRPNPLRRAMVVGLAAAVMVCGILFLLFILNQKVRDAKELSERYNVPILSEIPRRKEEDLPQSGLLIDDKTPSHILEAYNKLRMNLGFAMVDKRHILLVSSAVPSEGKSTIAANLAITYSRCGRKVLLIDGDMRRSVQNTLFKKLKKKHMPGLSNLIIKENRIDDAIVKDMFPNLDVLFAGSTPPNPSELLSSKEMRQLLTTLEQEHGYDIIIIDTPPINIVPDPLILADEGVSMIYVTRQNFSDHRDIRKALGAIEFSKMDLLGLVFYGENVTITAYYRKNRYYSHYYKSYERNLNAAMNSSEEDKMKWELTDNRPKSYSYKRTANADTQSHNQ